MKIGSWVQTKVGRDVGDVYAPAYSIGRVIDAFADHGILYLLVEFDDIIGENETGVNEWYCKNQLKEL